jgi:hypothetical protein
MGSDEEIGQHSCANAAEVTVPRERFSSEKKRRPRHSHDRDTGIRQRGVELIDSLKTDRCFGIDHVVDEQWAVYCRILQLEERPIQPV